MNKIFIALLFVLLPLLVSAQTTGKVVTNLSGEIQGRYVGENKTSYHIAVQDDVWIPKKGMKVITYSAAKGQGWVYTQSDKPVNMRKAPKATAAIITKLTNEDFVPTCYPCLGMKNGWFKIKAKGKVGYVSCSLFEWDAIQAF